ncbi:MAG: GNAT family N-acetyltransferase [Candidatus Helarchaeota archaeon]
MIKIKILSNPNFDELAKCIGNEPKQRRWKAHPDWGKELLQFHAPNTNLYIGAFDNNKLVGCMIAHEKQLKIKKSIFKAAIIAITEVIMDYRGQGIATEMLKTMIDQIKSLKIDFILAFQVGGRGGKNILKNAGFTKISKFGHATKILDEKKMESLINLNPILKKIAMKLVDSNIGQIKPINGIIRTFKNEDLDQVIELLNTHSDILDIGTFWTKQDLEKKLNWRYKLYVLDKQGTILASIITYNEISNIEDNYFIGGFMKNMVFSKNINDLDKEIFLNNILCIFKKENIPNVMYPSPKDVINILKKAGFQILPTNKRNVYIKSISDPVKDIIENIEKFKLIDVFLIC